MVDKLELSPALSHYIRELRHECRERRINNRELAAAQEELKATLRSMGSRLILAEAKAQAMAEGLIHPDWVDIADLTGVEINDLGEIVGLREAIARFKIQKPHLFRREQ